MFRSRLFRDGIRIILGLALALNASLVIMLMLAGAFRFHDYTFTFELRNPLESLSVADAAILARSAAVALMTSIIAFSLVEHALSGRWTWLKCLAIVGVYGMDPVIRALSYQSLIVEVYSDGWLAGSPLDYFLRGYALPALALAVYYAPLYAGVRIWEAVAPPLHTYQHPRRILFTVLQPAFRRAPLGLGVLFLFALFDTWIAPLASGRLYDFWGNMILTRIRDKDVEGALFSCLVGFVLAGAVTAALFGLRSTWDRFFPRWRPAPGGSLSDRGGLEWAWYLTALLALWPFWWLYTRGMVPGTTASFSLLVVLSQTITVVALVLVMTVMISGLALSLYYAPLPCCRPILDMSAWILVLAPEVVFVVGGTYLMASKTLLPGLLSMVLLFSGFTTALVFLAVRAFLDTSGSRHIYLFSSVSSFSVLRPFAVLLSGYPRELAIAGVLIAWLVWENVMLMAVALGPGFTTTSITLFNGASRGIDLLEAQLTVASFVIKAGLLGAVAAWLAWGRVRDDIR